MPKITPDFLSKARTNVIYVKKGEQSSRFRVDLPRLAAEEKEQEAELRESLIKKTIRNWRAKFSAEKIAKERKDLVLGFSSLNISLFASRTGAVKHLAFYPLWRLFILFFKLVFQISYYLGYIIVYILRFIAAGFKYLAFFVLGGISRRKARRVRQKVLKERAIRNFIESRGKSLPAVDTEISKEIKFSLEKVKVYKTVFYYIKKKFWKDRRDKIQEEENNKEKHRPGLNIKNWRFSKANFAPAIYFMVALLVFTLPFKALTYYQGLSDLKGKVLGVSETAVSQMGKAAKEAGQENFISARNNFIFASRNFSLAQESIGDISGLFGTLARIVPNDRIKLAAQAEKIFNAGEITSLMGAKFSQMMNLFNKDNMPVAAIMADLPAYSDDLADLGNELNAAVSAIDRGAIPVKYGDTFVAIKEKTALLSRSLDEFKQIINITGDILGYNGNQRYLMVFQNNTELRASGGFIGSYALIDFSSGEIKNLEVPGGGSYDTEAGLYDMIKSPAALQLVSPRWYFWDANWWPDWPLSAEKLMWFYEKSNGPTVDGVISLTPTVLEGLLKIAGEIDLSAKYGVKINSDNFWKITQTIAEEKPAPAVDENGEALAPTRSEPKKIIGDLFSALIEELPKRLNKDTIVRLIFEIEKLASEKQILLYFTDPNIEKTIKGFGWGGEVADTAWDYLMVINTNIAGAKTDRQIVETIDHVSAVQNNNTIINTVTIKRIHTGQKGEEFTGVRNVDWMRVYVPAGSELISATGFKKPHGRYFEAPEKSWQDDPDVARLEGQAMIDEESGTLVYTAFNKTVFANWSMIEPGEIGEIVIKYKLPFKFRRPEDKSGAWQSRLTKALNPEQEDLLPYALYAQKQPGSIGSIFHSKLIMPDNYTLSWSYGVGLQSTARGWDIQSKLDKDKFWAIVAKEK